MQNYSTLENHVKKWPMETKNESESDIKHEADLKTQQRKKQWMEGQKPKSSRKFKKIS